MKNDIKYETRALAKKLKKSRRGAANVRRKAIDARRGAAEGAASPGTSNSGTGHLAPDYSLEATLRQIDEMMAPHKAVMDVVQAMKSAMPYASEEMRAVQQVAEATRAYDEVRSGLEAANEYLRPLRETQEALAAQQQVAEAAGWASDYDPLKGNGDAAMAAWGAALPMSAVREIAQTAAEVAAAKVQQLSSFGAIDEAIRSLDAVAPRSPADWMAHKIREIGNPWLAAAPLIERALPGRGRSVLEAEMKKLDAATRAMKAR